MPDDLEFKIKITADNEAVPEIKKTGAALEETGNAGKKAEEKVTVAANEGNKAKREAREIIGHLGREFPAVGELLRVGFMGVTGAILLAVKAVTSFLEQIQDLGNSSTPEFETLTKAVEASKHAIEEADRAAKEYERTLEAIRVAAEAIQAASAAAQKAASEKSGRDSTTLDKTHGAQTQSIDAAEKAGAITHEQALVAKFRLDEDYSKKRLELETKLQAQLLALKYQEQGNLEIQAKTLERKLGPERKTAAQTAAAAARAPKVTERDQAALDAEQKKREDLETKQEELSGFHPFKSEILLRQQRSQNQKEIDATDQTIQSLRRRITQDTAKESTTRDAADDAKAAKDADEERLRQDTQDISKSRRELPREQSKFDADRASAQQGAAIDTSARNAQMAGQFIQNPGMLAGAEAAASAMEHGKQAGADQKQMLGALIQVLGGNKNNMGSLIQLISRAQNDITAQARLIQQLQQQIRYIGHMTGTP